MASSSSSYQNSGSNHVNPFYIEPAQQQQHWEGDYWQEDDGLDEEGFLLNDNDDNDKARRHQRAHQYYRGGRGTAPTPRRERCIILSTVSLVLILVSWAAISHSDNNKGAHKNDDEDEWTDASRVHDDVSYPDRVILLGERHSGVDFYQEKLTACFPQVPFDTVLTRDTVWFQDEPDDDDNDESLQFIYLIRDPYEWVEAMRTVEPWMSHMPNHCQDHEALPWNTFVETPWTMATVPNDGDAATTVAAADTTTTTTVSPGTTPTTTVAVDPGVIGAATNTDADAATVPQIVVVDPSKHDNDDELLGLFDDALPNEVVAATQAAQPPPNNNDASATLPQAATQADVQQPTQQQQQPNDADPRSNNDDVLLGLFDDAVAGDDDDDDADDDDDDEDATDATAADGDEQGLLGINPNTEEETQDNTDELSTREQADGFGTRRHERRQERWLNEEERRPEPALSCQLGFDETQVVPCHLPEGVREGGDAPVYELDPAAPGQPFASLLELRAAKIRHVYSDLPERWKRATAGRPLVVLHYEHSVWDSLEHLQKITGWQRDGDECKGLNVRPPALDHTLAEVDPAYETYLTEHLNWQTEQRIGYHARKQ